MKRKNENYRGSILAISVIMLAIILTSALSIALVVIKQKQAALGSAKSNVAFYNADAGVEQVMNDIKNKSGEKISSLTNFSSGKITVLGKYFAILKDENGAVITDGNVEVNDISSVKVVGTGANQEQRAIDAVVGCKKEDFKFRINMTTQWSAKDIVDGFSGTSFDTSTIYSVALADVNKDGLADLFLGGTKNQGMSPHVFAYKNSGTGSGATRWVRQNGSGGSDNWEMDITEMGIYPPLIRLADIDNDGKKDLIAGGYLDGSVKIYFNSGSDTDPSWPALADSSWSFLTGDSDVTAVAVGFINDDGRNDILTSSSEGMHVFKNTGSGFQLESGWLSGLSGSSEYPELFNYSHNDPAALFIVRNYSMSFSLRSYSETGSGSSVTWTSNDWYKGICNDVGGANGCPSGFYPMDAAIGDIDGNGMADIVFFQNYSEHKLYFFKHC